MGSAERVQTKTTCTPAELDAWVDQPGVIDELADRLTLTPARTILRTTPPCLGCGGPTGGHDGNALTVETAAFKGSPSDPDTVVRTATATFAPCGCVLTITKPPDRPLRA